MIRCQIRLVSEDVRLETRALDAVPTMGDEVVIAGEGYVVAAPPSEVVNGEAIVYVAKPA